MNLSLTGAYQFYLKKGHRIIYELQYTNMLIHGLLISFQQKIVIRFNNKI